MGPGVCTAAGESDLGQLRPDGIQPVNGRGGTLRESLYQSRIIEIVSAFHGILYILFNSVINSLLFLIMGLGRVHAAGSPCCIAARVRHLLYNENVFARFRRFDGGCHTGAAGTNNDNIHVQLFGCLFHRFFGFFLLRLGNVRSRLAQGCTCSSDHGHAGNGSAGNRIHVSILGFHDPVTDHFDGNRSDIFGLMVTGDLNIRDIMLIHCYADIHITAKAAGAGFICARMINSGCVIIAKSVIVNRAETNDQYDRQRDRDDSFHNVPICFNVFHNLSYPLFAADDTSVTDQPVRGRSIY